MSEIAIPLQAPTELETQSNDGGVQAKLVIREGHLRVEQVSAAEIKSAEGNIADPVKLDTSNISVASETQAPEKPDLVTLMGGLEECKSWLIAYVASANQYSRNENDIYNKVKREFSVFTDKDEVLRELRAAAAQIPLIDMDEREDGTEKMYRTANSIRYLTDSCITLHFFMKGSGGVDRIIRENHKLWYEDESWQELGLTYECFYKILKGKVYKAMNGAIAGKYSGWPGVKEFAQKHTYSAHSHQIKFNELYRIMKKDFAAPHDIIRHMKMEDALEYSITTIPGIKIQGEGDEKKVVSEAEVVDLVKKVKHLQQSGVKNVSKEYAAFYPDSKDWTTYHMTYQKLNNHFRNVLNPSSNNRRRSKNTAQEEAARASSDKISSTVVDSTSKAKHSFQAIGVNLVNEKKRSRSEEDNRHVTYTTGEQTRSRSNSVAERDENTAVYLNTEKRSVVNVIGLPGTGKTTTLATLLGKAHNKTTPSTVLIISSNCCTTRKLLQFTSGTFLRACPALTEETRKASCTEEHQDCSSSTDDETSGDSFIVHDEVTSSDKSYEKLEKPSSSPPSSSPELIEGALEEGEIRDAPAPAEEEESTPPPPPPPSSSEPAAAEEVLTEKSEAKPSKPKSKKSSDEESTSEPRDEFPKEEIPWMVYNDISEVLNCESEGRITVLHFPNYEDMDAETICAALERFQELESAHPKILIVDNQDVLTHPCNSNTLDKLAERHLETNMSVWVAGCNPQNLPLNILDYSTLSILHQFTSKFWYSELADHLPLTSVTFQHCQGLAPGQCVMVAPGAYMQHPVHSSSFCYPCAIVPPTPIN